MTRESNRWVGKLARLSVTHPWAMLGCVAAATVAALVLSSGLAMRMNWTDMLPADHPVVSVYNDIQDRFGEATIVIALEGERDRLVQMAEELEPRLRLIESLYNVDGKAPVEFLLDHGFVLQKPNHFERALRMYHDPSLAGVLRGLNDDYEREYTDSDDNLRRDEIEIARSLLGLTRSLEVLRINLTGDSANAPIVEAVNAILIGDPWALSLDRRMLLLFCTPVAPLTEFDAVISAVEQVEATLHEVSPRYPDVQANLTGMGKVSQDEMNSITVYTELLSVLTLLLIYILLARSFRSWLVPVIALLPLVVGIIWTAGLANILFGSLNIFTVMTMLVLLGLGIDFAIHLISRFYEERGKGRDVSASAIVMLGDTGRGVLTGGLTTAAAFLTLMIADTNGVFEFGAMAGAGVVLTLAAVFLTLPSLLALRERRYAAHIGTASNPGIANPHGGWPALGRLAAVCWRARWTVLAILAVFGGLSLWASTHTAFEYDWLELEPAGLKSVDLQREIPRRFGVSDHAAWLVAPTIEDARSLKEKLRKQHVVGDVSAISDVIPPLQRVADYNHRLEEFRKHLHERDPHAADFVDSDALAVEIERLWDNLDLMSNLAFQAGLDRIVQGIDRITGYDTALDETDSTAVLPQLSSLLYSGIEPGVAASVAVAWQAGMHDALLRISNPSAIEIDELPEQLRRLYLPRDGGKGYLVHVVPRDYLYDKRALDRFIAQTDAIDPSIVGTPELFLVMMEETLRDGRNGAFLALLVIVVLLLVHFRGAIGLLAMVPLAGGALFMLGIMYLLGMKYNYVNLIAVPIILGIGIDDGVHALHRFRAEASTGSARIIASFRHVGRAIMLTSLTTMIGFGSIGLYEMRGMASFGQVLFIGVGLCFISTVFVLPAVLRVFVRPDAPAPGGRGGGVSTKPDATLTFSSSMRSQGE